MSSSLGETEASRSLWRTTGTATKKAAAISSSDKPRSRKARKARNWSSGCSGARCTFSASESSSAMPSLRTTHGTGAVFARRFCRTSSSSAR
jgi:hypothetical protein